MNERIKELAEQVVGPSRLHGGDFALMGNKQVEKFAELIVRECIDVIGEDNYTMLTGKAYCTELKRHFGVEE